MPIWGSAQMETSLHHYDVIKIARINSDWDGLYQDILDWNYKAGLIDGPYIQKCVY